jgi:PAS domain S-box-containing protein
MVWYPNPYAFALFVFTLVTGGVALYAWRHRAMVGLAPALTLLGVTIWTLGYGVATGVHDLEGRIFWAKFQHLGIALTPVALIAFVLRYTDHTQWLTWRRLSLLAVVPFLGVVLAWSNELHGLIWAHIDLVIEDSVAFLRIQYGPYFWFYAAYNHLVVLASAILFLQTYLRSSHLHRRQSAVMLIGVLCVGVTNVLYLTGLNPFPNLDLTPFGSGVGGVILVWGLFRYRLFDIVPVARDKVIESIGDGVVVLDTRDRIVDANPAACRLIGRSAGEIIGQPAVQVFSGQPDLVERYRNVYEARAEVALDGEGGPQHYDLRISPLTDRRGNMNGRLIVLHDITERVQVEEMLRLYAAELEAHNAELDAFAHTVAHDLKNPLTNIIGYVDFMFEDLGNVASDNKQCLEDLAGIDHNARKMHDIVEGLLLLAVVRKQQVKTTPLDMTQIVSEVLHQLDPQIKTSQAEIVLPTQWPVALGYALWVERVWANYISNAIKYGGQPPRVELGSSLEPCTPEAQPEIENHGNPMPQVRFWVRDNGPGLPAENRAELFTPFTYISRHRAEGHGLGLSIVHRIVEKLGGQVGVESETGKGSTFYFTLPVAPGHEK